MYDDYSTRLQADDARFVVRPGNKVVEIFGEDVLEADRFKTTSKADAEIPNWLATETTPNASKPLLRVLVCAPEVHRSDAEVLPLPISRASMQAIQKAWHFPSEFIRMLLSTMPIASRFSVAREVVEGVIGDGATGGDGRDEDMEDDEKKSLLIEDLVEVDTGAGAAMVPPDPQKHGVVEENPRYRPREQGNQEADAVNTPKRHEGLMFRGGRSKDWNYCLAMTQCPKTNIIHCIVHGLQEAEINTLETCLRNSMEHASHPMLLPIIVLECKIHHFAVLLERRAQDLDKYELTTGQRHGADQNVDITFAQRLKSRKEIDFDLITQKLTGLLATLSFCDLTFQVGERSLKLVEEVAGKNTMPDVFERRIIYLKGLICGAQDMRRLLVARAQAQVQTVYSLISQRDAEAGLQENFRMRAIAIVTFIFLPLTAVATFFSTSFWNWGPKDDTKLVSHWVWVYFVVTIVITIAVFWIFQSMMQRQKRKRNEMVKSE